MTSYYRSVMFCFCLFLLGCHAKNTPLVTDAEAESVHATDPASNPLDAESNFASKQEYDDARVLQHVLNFYFPSAPKTLGSPISLPGGFMRDLKEYDLGISPSIYRSINDALLSNQSGMGFAICVSNKTSTANCRRDGTLGYGICSLKNTPSTCNKDGSVGYGLCTLTYPPTRCNVKGTLGYGLCSSLKGASGSPKYSLESVCPVHASIGYALCLDSSRGNASICAPYSTATIGFGICSLQSGYNITQCKKDGFIGYGLCTARNSLGKGCVPSMTLGYGLCMMRHQSINLCDLSSN